MASNPERRVRATALLFWFVPAVIATIGFSVVPSRLNPGISTAELFLSQVAMWGGWACWSTLTWWIGDRIPWRRGRRLHAVATYLVLGCVVVALQILLQARLAVAFGLAEPRGLESTLAIGLRTSGDYFVVVFCAIVVAQLAFRWHAQWQAERLVAARLGEDLAQAQLRALQAQLNPHFLFNALNSVVTLIARDPGAAQQMVVRLGDLLRATLRTGAAQEVLLSTELEITRRYLDIEQIRFADRLSVDWPTGAIPHAMVPAFALQPLVENAIVHGISRIKGAGTVAVEVDRAGEALLLRVRDTGAGLSAPNDTRGSGTGLANLRARIHRLYGSAATLDVHAGVTGGTVATLCLPFVAPPATEGNGTQMSRVASSDVPAVR